jgi:hypothetical protein
MAYSDIALLADDRDFRGRIAAAASSEDDHLPMHPLTFADTYQWQIAGAPGFGDAYASAVAGDVERPGNDPAVISDAQILAVVQPLLAALPSSGPPPPNP